MADLAISEKTAALLRQAFGDACENVERKQSMVEEARLEFEEYSARYQEAVKTRDAFFEDLKNLGLTVESCASP